MALPRIIQIEVTTACQLRCVFCPRTVLADQWVTAHLPWEKFSSLLPFVRRTRQVHLQGWGEPLLHPRLWDMAAAIKERHGRVSLTTNAVLLDEAASREACRTGVDLVAISVAGAKAATNDPLRVGSHLDQICANVAYLCQLKPRPEVNLVMQMMKPNLEELPELVTLASRLGADGVVVPNLDYIPTAEVDALKAFSFSPDLRQAELTDEAQARGKELGVNVRIYPLRPSSDILVCEADPVHNVWITVWGEVAPCPYLALPYRNDIPRLFWGKEEHLSRFSFGKVTDGLDQVMKGQAARSFQDAFARRLQTDRLDTMTAVALSAMPRVRSTSRAFLEPLAPPTSLRKPVALLPPPDLCRNCYKFYGL
ncbi:MAG: radical SAM/SPASM domain-containing protein [Dehalococcoidales bacterium]